ncbi:MAG: hypothetical protein Q9204_000929 [Flavoplaca sp. TL-2023a]
MATNDPSWSFGSRSSNNNPQAEKYYGGQLYLIEVKGPHPRELLRDAYELIAGVEDSMVLWQPKTRHALLFACPPNKEAPLEFTTDEKFLEHVVLRFLGKITKDNWVQDEYEGAF